MGDFNSIRSEKDKFGCTYNGKDMHCFNSFISDLGLVEIQGSNYEFTWYGPRDKMIVNRIESLLMINGFKVARGE